MVLVTNVAVSFGKCRVPWSRQQAFMFTYGSIQQCCERCCSTNAPNERIRTNKFERENERIVTAANRKVNRMSQRVSWKYYSTSEGMIKRTEQQCYTHKPRKLRTKNHQPNNPTNARTIMIESSTERTNNHTVEPTSQQCVHYCWQSQIFFRVHHIDNSTNHHCSNIFGSSTYVTFIDFRRILSQVDVSCLPCLHYYVPWIHLHCKHLLCETRWPSVGVLNSRSLGSSLRWITVCGSCAKCAGPFHSRVKMGSMQETVWETWWNGNERWSSF